MRKFIVKINGVSYEAEVEEITSVPAESTQSKPEKQAEPAAAAAPAQTAAPAGGTSVTAPMPGTIKKVMVSVGTQVKKNDVVFILEAMKLENEIYAPCDGMVSFVGTQEGAMVNPGDTLCKIG